MGVQVEDAGKSECPAVMVGIGVRTLPHPKGEPTSYAGVTERQRRSKLLRRLSLQWAIGDYRKRPSVQSLDWMSPCAGETFRRAGCAGLPARSAVPVRRVITAFVMLEPYTVKVVRTVLRGEGAARP